MALPCCLDKPETQATSSFPLFPYCYVSVPTSHQQAQAFPFLKSSSNLLILFHYCHIPSHLVAQNCLLVMLPALNPSSLFFIPQLELNHLPLSLNFLQCLPFHRIKFKLFALAFKGLRGRCSLLPCHYASAPLGFSHLG